MAAGAEVSGETVVVEMVPSLPKDTDTCTENINEKYANFKIKDLGKKDIDYIVKDSDSMQMEEIVDILKKLKLNPLAKEFFPSSHKSSQMGDNNSVLANKISGNEGFANNQRRNNYDHGRRRMGGRTFRARREDNIRRTVYVSGIDHNITEEQLAGLFSSYGQVDDCRVCGDPHSRLRFAFVEFADEYSARAALSLSGTLLGFSHVKVLPSKTAILPVNPTFLPMSEDEREMCARTVYCTNIDNKISQDDVKSFFKTRCGEVSRLRLLGDHMHSMRIAFVEFFVPSARAALSLSGTLLGFSHVKVLPSKTAILPVNPTFLPMSEDEREMCARTVYCTNIDNKISQDDVKSFFKTRCGEVSRLRLLGDHMHSMRIAFVEFSVAESALLALDYCGEVLGSERIRVSPSKTPVRPRVPYKATF